MVAGGSIEEAVVELGGIVRLWLLMSAMLAVLALAWAFAPILVALVLVALLCAGVAALAIALARAIERRRGTAAPTREE